MSQRPLSPSGLRALGVASLGIGLGALALLSATVVFDVSRPARADDKPAGDKPKAEDGELSLAGKVPSDVFNDKVKNKDGGDQKPCRGGVLRLRFPSDPKSLQPIIDNDEPTRQVQQYLTDALIDRDRETFEWLPTLCRYWVTRDVVVLKAKDGEKEGKRLEGRVVSEDENGIVFAEGAQKWTLCRHELEKIDEAGGKVVWKDGFGKGEIAGKISYWPGGKYTVYVEETPKTTVKIATSEIATIEEEADGKKTTVPGVIRECVYETKLRSGVKWHDGEPFKAEDVVFTYETIMNPGVLSGSAKSYCSDTFHPDVSKAVCKIAPDVVRFELKKQYFAAIGTIGGIVGAYIIPAHRYQAEKFKGDPKGFAEHFNKHPEHEKTVGCGPYKLARWERSKFVEITRNQEWWASQKGQGVPWIDPLQPYLDKIRWTIILNKNAGFKELMKEEVDADFDVEQLTWVGDEANSDEFKKRFVRAQFLGPPYTYIGYNLRRPGVDPKKNFFNDPKVRLAMTMLIDRKTILEKIHFGLGEMVTGPFFIKGPHCDKKIEPIEYNPEKAKTLLDQAGWIDHDGDGVRDKDGVKFEFTYSVHSAREYHLKIAEIVKQDIEKAGIKVSIRSTDFNSFLDDVNARKFDVIRFAWGEPDCIDTDPYQIWHSSQWDNQGSNHTGYANPEVDTLLEKARRELDFKKRQRIMKRIHRIIHEDQPYTFLFNLYELYFYNKKFQNVKFYILGNNPYIFTEWFIPKELQGDAK